MSETVAVFGATGHIGSAVCKALSTKGYTIRAITRTPDSEKAKSLNNETITVVKGDFNEPATLDAALEGVDAAFVTTSTEHTNPDAKVREVLHGKAIADACQRAGIKHIVYNTKLSVVKMCGIGCRHLDAKNEIELYFRKLDLPVTYVIVPCLYEMLLQPPLRPKRQENGGYKLDIPMGNTSLDMISVVDTGEIISKLFQEKPVGKTISLSGNKMTIKEMAATLTKFLQPKTIKDGQITVEQYRDLKFPSAPDLAYMFDFFTRVDQRASMDGSKKLYPPLQSFVHWVQDNTSILNKALDYEEDAPRDPWA